MKNESDAHLDRLLAGARRAGWSHGPEIMPRSLQARILADWRRTGAEQGQADFLVLLFRRALICAALLMVASLVWSVADDTVDDEQGVDLAAHELQNDLMP